MKKKVLCPNCQMYHYVEIDEPDPGSFENRARRLPFRVEAAAVPMNAPGAGFVRESPAGLPTLQSHVQVPLAQALISGSFFFPIATAGTVGFLLLVDAASSRFELTNWGLALFGGAGGALISFSIAGLKWESRRGFYDSLLTTIEEITGYDLNGDDQIGELRPEPKTVTVEIKEKGIPREIDTIGIDQARLSKFAYLVMVEGKSPSGRTAIEAGISREEEWVPFRDKLIGRRWAAWKVPGAPKQGITLLAKGEAILKALLPPDSGAGVSKNGGIVPPTQGPATNYERFQFAEE